MSAPAPDQRQQQGRLAPGPSETVPATSGSQTATQTTTVPAPAVLRLRGAHTANSRSVRWAQDVVNNEGLGRKSSKVCCIYHAPRAVDESSDDDSSSSSSDASSESDSGGGDAAKKTGNGHGHGHNHDNACHDKKPRRRGRDADLRGGKRKPSPNAYERMPKQPRGGAGGAPAQKPPSGT